MISSDGRNRRNCSQGDAFGASSSTSSTDGSRRAIVPQDHRHHQQKSSGFLANERCFFRRASWPPDHADDRAMPVSSTLRLAHARTSAIDSAAAAAAAAKKKHTADVKWGVHTPGTQKTSLAFLPFLYPNRSTLTTPRNNSPDRDSNMICPCVDGVLTTKIPEFLFPSPYS